MAAPRVFLSYADDALWWVRDCFKPYFDIGNVVLVDCKAEDVAFGEFKSALDDYLEGYVAVVAIKEARTQIELKCTQLHAQRWLG